MDRNTVRTEVIRVSLPVALRKESVDRNSNVWPLCLLRPPSLSARRAWIEISVKDLNAHLYYVALRKESVDRNLKNRQKKNLLLKSLSARRAWIEIARIVFARLASGVALRKESVDRNARCRFWALSNAESLSARRAWIEISVKDLNAHLYYRRSPQGERG